MQIIDKAFCNGCSACYNACPKNCISMLPDKNGFLCPSIDESRCIDCGLCKKTCPVFNKKEQTEKTVQAYAIINKNDNVRKNSSSGGVFTQIAKYVLSKNGVVFGALFDENFKVKHAYIESENDLIKLQKSKYVQSEMGASYKEAKDFLEQGRLVLFTGTPCQIGGLQAYLKKNYENLITQDFICHGVPSPKVWQIYVAKKQEKGEVKDISFRDKCLGWNRFSMTFNYKDKRESKTLATDLYMQLFLKNVILRDSCHNCAFKNKYRDSDITLADYWGVENVHPQFNDDMGVSLVVINSKKGIKIFNEIKHNFICEQTDLDKAIIYNPCMVKSVEPNKNRAKFFKKLDKRNFEKLARKCLQPPLSLRLKIKLKKILMNKK